jgi:hypothetical protein
VGVSIGLEEVAGEVNSDEVEAAPRDQ